MGGRMRYGIGMGLGLVAHGVTSQWSKYWSTSFSAQPVLAAGMYSGDYFQMLQSQREAEALQQTARLGRNYAPAMVASQGMMGLGMAAAMAATGPIGWGVAGVGLIGGTTLNMLGSYRQTEGQAAIDSQTAKVLARIRTGQRMQTSTEDVAMSAMGAIKYAGDFGAGFASLRQVDAWRWLGGERGFGARQSIDRQLAFLQAGGRFGSPHIATTSNYSGSTADPGLGLSGRIYDLEQRYGISAGTAGLVERALMPGGGARGAGTSVTVAEGAGSRWMDYTIGVAQRMGVGPQRMDEFVRRTAMLEQQYAERGAETPYGTAPWMLNTFNPGMQGMTTLSAAESMRATGVSLGDQLTESIMPQRLTNALLMTRVIGEGGGPLDWSKKLFDQGYMRKQYNKTGELLPDMLRPFFDAQVTNTVPELADTRIYSTVRPKPTEPTSPGAEDLEALAKLKAKEENLLIRNWETAVSTMTEKLNALVIAIENATFDLSAGQ
jgi:hypothetical protein